MNKQDIERQINLLKYSKRTTTTLSSEISIDQRIERLQKLKSKLF